jgi:hypothetical protein
MRTSFFFSAAAGAGDAAAASMSRTSEATEIRMQWLREMNADNRPPGSTGGLQDHTVRGRKSCDYG